MEAQVMADVLPFIPNVLKKLPWYVRATLYVLAAAGGFYLLLTWLFGWTPFPHAGDIEGVLALLAGAPAFANTPTGKKPSFSTAVTVGVADAEGLAKSLAAELAKIAPKSVSEPLMKFEGVATADVEKAAPIINTVGQDAVKVVDDVAPAAAPVVNEVVDAVANVAPPEAAK